MHDDYESMAEPSHIGALTLRRGTLMLLLQTDFEYEFLLIAPVNFDGRKVNHKADIRKGQESKEKINQKVDI